MTIRIYPTNWDRYLHAQGGAPDHRQSARLLAESGFCVCVHPDRKHSDSEVGVSCDTDLEILAVEWLFPGVGTDGPVQ